MSKIILILTGVLLCAPHLQAQTQSTVSDSLELEDIVITASKIPVSQRETTKPVLIIGREEIDRSAGKDFSQLLNAQNGIRVNNAYGTPGTNTSLFLQGASGENTLILVDGLPIADPSGTGGAIDMRQFSLSSIERIEVLKGSQSTLYGTDAIAGVVNIITRNASDNPFSLNGKLSYGSYETMSGSAGINGTFSEQLSYSVNYSHDSSEGFSAAEDPTGNSGYDNDGFQQDYLFGKISYRPTSTWSITPSIKYSDYEGDYDSDAFADADNIFELNLFNPSLQAVYQSENFRVNTGYSYAKSDRLFASEFGENRFEGRMHNADVFATYNLFDELQILGGLHIQNARIPEREGEVEGAESEIWSPYTTLLLKDWNRVNAELGYRLNVHSEYGENSTFSFAPSYQINDHIKLFASFGTGFKAPTLDELYGQFGANDDLSPQKSRTFQVGIENYWFGNEINTEIHYFNRNIEDVIVYDASLGYINRDEQNNYGVETAVNWLIDPDITLGLFYNYQQGDVTTSDQTGQQTTSDNLYRKPVHSFGGSLDVTPVENLIVRVESEFAGERKDLYFNPGNNFEQEEVSLEAYTLVHLYAEYQFMNNRFSAFTEIKNILDTSFTEIYGFNTIKRSAKAGIRFSI